MSPGPEGEENHQEAETGAVSSAEGGDEDTTTTITTSSNPLTTSQPPWKSKKTLVDVVVPNH